LWLQTRECSRRCVPIPVKVFLTVNVEAEHADDIRCTLCQFDEVCECYAIADGPYDVVAFIEVDEFSDYRDFAVDKISTVPHITDYTSFIITGE